MCNGTPLTVEKISPRVRIELGPQDQKPALNPLSYRGELPVSLPATCALDRSGTLRSDCRLNSLSITVNYTVVNESDSTSTVDCQDGQPLLLTVELQWLEHLRNHKNMFEAGSSS